MNNVVDYYLFLNLVSGYDNTGKNTHLSSYDVTDENYKKFFITPWDLDGTFGRNWDSSETPSTDILSNNMYNKLLDYNTDNFKDKLKTKWNELRETKLTNEIIKQHFRKYNNIFISSKAAQREAERWEESSLNFEDEIVYIENWVDLRLSFLDDYINGL